jgi:hypothetical protein
MGYALYYFPRWKDSSNGHEKEVVFAPLSSHGLGYGGTGKTLPRDPPHQSL